jgi:hypothetical protein
MANAIILQGNFVSDGTAKIIRMTCDVDWMKVYNWTQAATQQTTGRGVEFYWQRGMAVDTGLVWKKKDSASDDLKLITMTSGGFSLYDATGNPIGILHALTGISDASMPIVSVSSTAGLNAGDIVRFVQDNALTTDAKQLASIDFSIDTISTDTSFRLPSGPRIATATGGYWRKINFEPIFYPRVRYITSIVSDTNTAHSVVKLTVAHGYTVGQKVRFSVTPAFGMYEINKMVGTVLAIDTRVDYNTITVDIDTTTFTPFAWPTASYGAFTPATISPDGENGLYPDSYADATRNTAYIGLKLAAGVVSPAGSASDLIYWTAGKSYSVDNV